MSATRCSTATSSSTLISRLDLTIGNWVLLSLISAAAAGNPSSISKNQEYLIRQWNVDDGLPQNRVTALAQTRDGFLWVGTQVGAARFDGVHFELFNRYNTAAFVNDAINCFAVAPNGDLWVGTHEGLLRLHDGGWTCFTTTNGLPNPDVWDIAFDHGGHLWVSAGGLVGRFPEGPFERVPTALEALPPARKFIRPAERALMVVTSEGPFALPLTAGPLFPLPKEVPPQVSALEVDDTGWLLMIKNALWQRTERGDFLPLLGLDPGLGSNLLYRDAHRTLWMAVFRSGLYRLNGGNLEPFNLTPAKSQPSPSAFMEDREGTLWVGTDDGLFQLQPRPFQAITRDDGLPGDEAWSISEAPDGTIWVATDRETASIDSSFSVAAVSRTPVEPAHRSIMVDSIGNTWMDSSSGLGIFATGGLVTFFLHGTGVHALFQDRNGRVWVGTAKGAYCFRDHRTPLPLDGLPSGDIRAIYQTRDGAIWFGSFGNGAQRWQDGKLQCFTTQDGLADDRVFTFHEDKSGILWIGTHNGLSRMPPAELGSKSAPHFQTYTIEHGLLDNLINHILEDEAGFLWFSCNRGIFRIARSELNAVADGRKHAAVCLVFGKEDGMPTSETNGEHQPAGCKARDGRLWFPTQRGVAVVDPAKLTGIDVPPIVLIEKVIAENEIVFGFGPSPGKPPAPSPVKVAFPAGRARVLEIHYTANSFIAPEKIRFKYKLEGHDRDWRLDDRSARVAYYPDLRPGEYAFQVIACNSHGIWNEQGAALAFSIAPHFYETRLFYVACGLGVIALAAWMQSYRLRVQNRIHALEQHAALEKERARIAQDMHDDLGSRLSQLSILGELTHRHLDTPQAARPHVQKLTAAASGIFQAMDEIVWAVNPKQDSLPGLASYLGEYAPEILEPAGIRCRFDFPATVPARPLTADSRHHLFLVIKEALHNVIKHAHATEVWLRLSVAGDRLTLAVEDNGCGFSGKGDTTGEPKADSHPASDFSPSTNSNGLKNMRSRMIDIGGQLEIESQPGQGMKLRLILPLNVKT